MDSTSAAVSACSRRSSSKPVAQLLVHLAERLHQSVDVGNAGAGEPWGGAGRDCPGRRADGNQGLGDGASRAERQDAPDEDREQGGAGDGTLRAAHDVVNLIQPGGYPYRSGPAGNRDVEKHAADGRASPTRDASAAGQCDAHFRPLARDFESAAGVPRESRCRPGPSRPGRSA